MIDKDRLIQLARISDALQAYPKPENARRPSRGWARTIRKALGMTQVQLAARLGISRQSVQDLELAEAERRITLDSMDRLARALNCRLVYAFVPESGSLDEMLERQANIVAESMIAQTNPALVSESPAANPKQQDRERKLIADMLLRGSPRKLWQ